MTGRRGLCAAAILTFAAIGAVAARAADEMLGQDPAGAIEQRPGGKAFDISDTLSAIAVPIPVSNPTIGSGFALAGGMFYQFDELSSPSYTGIGYLRTDNGTWAGALRQSISLQGDRYRASLLAGYGSFNYSFFGVGAEAGESGRSVPVTQQGYMVRPQVQARMAPDLYVGLSYRFVRIATTPNADAGGGRFAGMTPPEAVVVATGPGVVLTYDTRDNSFMPSDGELIEGEIRMSDAAFFADRSYGKATVAYNTYRRVGEREVLAWRAAACQAQGSVPVFDLCLFGASSDLRGFEVGRYRDHSQLAAQGEYRWQPFARFGFVGFAGLGSVAENPASHRLEGLLGSAGGGVRALVSSDYRINAGIDVAVTSGGDRAVYFLIGEAF